MMNRGKPKIPFLSPEKKPSNGHIFLFTRFDPPVSF